MRILSVVASDFGYNNDANLPGSHDPNSERSDLNGDYWVDLDDIAVMAELWLVPVFDAYRICSLCNIGQNTDPNDPDTSGVIDVKDYEAMMADWGKEVELGFSASFYDKADQPVEPNQLSGVIAVQVDECPVSSWVFAQVDGLTIGQTYADDGMLPKFVVRTHEFTNGNHLVAVGGQTPDGGCWIRHVPVRFENYLYLASIPQSYKSNKLYEIRGFFDEGMVEISTDPNNIVSSTNGHIVYSGILNDDNPTVSMECHYQTMSIFEDILPVRVIDVSEIDPNSYRAVIIAPHDDVNDAFEDNYLNEEDRTLTSIRYVLDQMNIPYIELLTGNANWDNIKVALTNQNVHYVYWLGHANCQVGVGNNAVQRTALGCWEKGEWVYTRGRIFSFVLSETSNPEYDRLPDNWDRKGHSMYSLGLWRTGHIKEFWAIGCKSGTNFFNRGQNDMALAVGVYDYKDSQRHYTHVYIGNNKEIISGGLASLVDGYASAISKIIRRHMTTNLDNAFNTSNLGNMERNAIWGTDGDRDGEIENTLQWWPANIELFRVIFP